MLTSVYIACTIYGLAVMLIDLTGILSHFGEDHGDTDGEGATASDHAETGDISPDSYPDPEPSGSVLMHHRRGQDLVLRLMTALRSTVYFSLGFGATGWFASGQMSALLSLPISVGVGMLTWLIAKWVRRLQRSELNSQIRDSDLLMAEALVTLPISYHTIGKILMQHENRRVERYAKALDRNDHFPKGSRVRVLEVADDFFYVGLV